MPSPGRSGQKSRVCAAAKASSRAWPWLRLSLPRSSSKPLRLRTPKKDQPWFLYLGTIDTHGPWIARKPWIDIYSPGPYKGPFTEYGTAKGLGFQPGRMGCSIIPAPADIDAIKKSGLKILIDSQDVRKLVGFYSQTFGLTVKEDGEHWGEIRVADSGPGIAEHMLAMMLAFMRHTFSPIGVYSASSSSSYSS